MGVAMIAVPPVVVGMSDTVSIDPLWATLRLAALEAFTLISANLVIGAFRPWFNRIAKPRTIQRLHVTLDLVAFAVALAHGVTAAVYGIAGYEVAPLWVGPASLALSAGVILTALARRRLKGLWLWMHRLNYVIFAAVLAHALILGYDLQADRFLKVCFAVYTVAVAAGLMYRVTGRIRGRRTSA